MNREVHHQLRYNRINFLGRNLYNMTMITITKRLERVATYVPQGAIVADIGSDHAYLPVYLMQKKQIEGAIAGEVVKGPFESAVSSVKSAGLMKDIDVRLGDGLQVISPKDSVSCVTICGMGGELIASILEMGKKGGHITGKERLVLQANVAEHIVRKWLMANQYQIIAEEILEDNHRLYEIIVAEKVVEDVHYSDLELQYGVFLTKEKSALACEKWQGLLNKYQYVLEQLKKSSTPQVEKLKKVEAEMEQLKELL